MWFFKDKTKPVKKKIKKKKKKEVVARKRWGYMQNKKTTTNRLDRAFDYQDKKKKD